MTTTVEPEQQSHRLRGKRLLILIGAALVGIILIIAAVHALSGDDPDSNDTSPLDLEQEGPFISEASFVLQNPDTLSLEERAYWNNMTFDQIVSKGVPYTRYNRYYTRFFLKKAETVEIMIESGVPLGADLSSGQEGISVMLIPDAAPYGQTDAYDYVPPTEGDNGGYFEKVSRAGNRWQARWAIAALESDYYWLILTNTARQDAWCHFTISMP